MSDLSFVAGEFPGLASTSREAAEAVRSARPEGGGSAFASAMPGTPLSSDMQGAEEKIADRSMDNAKDLEQAADSLESSERDFIAAEEENGQLIGSIMPEQGGASTAVGHSYGRGGSADGSRPYGGRGGVEAKPYTGGAKVEAKPFSEELGGVVNL